MWIGRWIGRLFLAAALLVLGADLRPWLDGQAFELSLLAGIWSKLNPASYAALQPAIQDNIDGALLGRPLVWPVVEQIVAFPAIYVLAVLGLIFLYLFRRRRPRPY